MVKMFAYSGEPEQTLHSAASDLSALFTYYSFGGLQIKMKENFKEVIM